MSRWFRFYGEALNDPKVQNLPADLFKMWVNLLCIASQHDGQLPVIHELTYLLRRRCDRVERDLNELVNRGLIDLVDEHFEPHKWSERQYISDTSSSRVKKYRERRAAAGLVQQWSASAELKSAIFQRDGDSCAYCRSMHDLTIDHRTPVHRGGTDDLENLQVLCRSCNGAKRDMTHDEFVNRNVFETFQKRPQTSETEAETEKKDLVALSAPSKKVSRRTTRPIPAEWQPTLAHADLAKSINVNMKDTEERFRDYLASTGKLYADYDAAFRNFIKNAPKFNGGPNGHGGSRPLQEDEKSSSRAAGRLAEAARRGEFSFGPRPSLLPGPDEDAVQLLSKG